MKRVLPFTFLLFSVRPASADIAGSGGDAENNYDPGPAARRSGFAAGASLGALFGGVSGYPNEVEKIDVPEFEARTNEAGGVGGGFWIGAALRDFLVVGLGLNFGSVAGADGALSNGGAFVMHVEGYPLFYTSEALRDFGIVGEFGAGSRDVLLGSRKAADGGLVSYASLGLLYQPIRIGKHLSAGPIVQVSHQFSTTLSATLASAGMQLTFYGGPG